MMTNDRNLSESYLNTPLTAPEAAIGLGQTLMESFRMPYLPFSEIVEFHVRYHQNP